MQRKKIKFNFRERAILAVFIVVVFAGFYGTSSAAINQQINYQGKLTDASNVAKPDGNYNMILSLYTVASGGTPVWTARGTTGTPTARSVALLNGIFSIMLGDTGAGDNALTGLDFNSPYYLGVAIGSDAEMTPRKPIGAAAYAFNSSLLNGLASATTGATAHIAATDSSGNLTISGSTYFNGTTYYINSSGTGNMNGLTLAGNAAINGGGITSTGALTVTPNAGTNFNVALSTTGDFAVNTNQLYVDTSTGNVGIGTSSPSAVLHVVGANATSGNDAPSALIITGGKGGTYNGSNGPGSGGAVTITSGAGGNGAGPTSNGANGSNITLNPGAGGTGTVAGSYGNILLATTGGNVGIGTATPSSSLDIEKLGTSKATTSLLELTNSKAAADMDNTGTAILFNQFAEGGPEPDSVFNAGQITVLTETDWSSASAATQDSSMTFATVLDGSMAEKMRISSAGNVGIGTGSPDRPLVISSANNALAAGEASAMIVGAANKERFELRSLGSSPGSVFQGKGAGGTVASPTKTIAGNILVALGGSGYQETTGAYITGNKAFIGMYAAEDFTSTANGTYITFETTPLLGTTRTEKVRIDSSGNVGIGTTGPENLLHVAGGSNPAIEIQGASDTGSEKPYLIFKRSRGTLTSPTAVMADDYLAQLTFNAANGNGTFEGIRRFMQVDAAENWDSSHGGFYDAFYTRANGTVGAPSERLRIDNAGNVGIGTTAPAGNLEVKATIAATGATSYVTGLGAAGYVVPQRDFQSTSVGAGDVLGGLIFAGINSGLSGSAASVSGYVDATGGTRIKGRLVFNTSDGTTNTERMRIDSAGNVGIGTTSPGYRLVVATPGTTASQLQINSANPADDSGMYLTSAASGNGFVSAGAAYNGSAWVAKSATAWEFGGGASGMTWYYDTGLTPGNTYTQTARLKIDTAGNVGIGTTSPGFPLDVAGSGRFSAAGATGIMVKNTSTSFGNVVDAGGAGNLGLISNWTIAGTQDDATKPTWAELFQINSDQLVIQRAPAGGSLASLMTINSSGYVGIGTTTPLGELQVSSTSTTNGNRGITIGQYATSTLAGLLNFRRANGTEASPVTLANGDYIGTIGFQGYGTAYTRRAAIGAVINGTVSADSVPTDITFQTGSTAASEMMRITSAGYVGIGTTSPDSPLTVKSTTVANNLGKFINDGVVGTGGIQIESYVSNASAGSGLYLKMARNSFASPTTLQASDRVGALFMQGYGASAFQTPISIEGYVGTTATSISDSVFPGYMVFKTTPDGSAARVERMRIDQNGNVGIGTTTFLDSSSKLAMASNTFLALELASHDDSNQSPSFIINISGGSEASPTLSAANSVIGSDIFRGYDGSGYRNSAMLRASIDGTAASGSMPGKLQFYTTPTGSTSLAERMRIDSSGNVGIGTTTPSSMLTLKGQMFIPANDVQTWDPGNGSGAGLRMGYSLTSDFGYINAHNTGVAAKNLALQIGGGNVGIGTTSPGYTFDVSNGGVAKSSLHFSQSGTDVGGWLTSVGDGNFFMSSGIMYDASAGGWIQKSSNGIANAIGGDTPGITFQTGSGATVGSVATTYARMRITPTGNIGIGTTAPTASFQVAQLTGGAGGTVTTNGTTAVVGVGTQFLNTFKVGDTITVSGETRTIATITDNTHLTTDTWTGSFAGAAYTLAGGTRFSVLGNGNVGIGTTSPAYSLDISGGDMAISNNQAYRVRDTGGTARSLLQLNSGNQVVIGSSGFSGDTAINTGGVVNAIYLKATTGNIGIGTTSPAEKLEVLGNIRLQDNETDATTKIGRMVVGHYTNSQAPLYVFGAASTSTNNYLAFGGGSSSYNAATQIDFYTAANTTTTTGTSRMTISSTGNVLVANLAGTGNRAVYSDASGNLTNSSSDARLKINVTDLSVQGDILDAIGKLRGVYYNWDLSNPYAKNLGGQREIGMLAQDVQKVFPELVGTNASGYLSLDYPKLTAVLTEGIKAQQTEITGITNSQDTITKQIANNNDQISSLVLKTDSNINTLAQLQTSVDEQLNVVGKSIDAQNEQISTSASTFSAAQKSLLDADIAAEVGPIAAMQATLKGQMDLLTEQAKAVTDLITTLDVTDIVYKDALGNVDLLGQFSAKGVETGQLTIKNTDKDAPTIGDTDIMAVVDDGNNDGIDDKTGSDGKSVEVQTTAVDKDCKIFTSFENDPGSSSWVEKTKDKDGNYTGFNIKLSAVVKKDAKVNWWIVKSQ